MSDYFNSDMKLFLDHRVDWKRLTKLRKGPDASPEDELETSKMVLQTADQICGDLEEAAAAGWHEEVRLEDGKVIKPRHIVDGYEKFRGAGLVSVIDVILEDDSFEALRATTRDIKQLVTTTNTAVSSATADSNPRTKRDISWAS